MSFDQLRQREFITLLAGAAAWPVRALGAHPFRMNAEVIAAGKTSSSTLPANKRLLRHHR
jgi:hypothetical protein